ncbi:MAG: hypothetical protein WCF36_04095 [Candidatus Nanopelagicales bacterium]
MERATSSTVGTLVLVLVLAAVYSAGLVAAGFVVPFCTGVSVSSPGDVMTGSATLVEQNGLAQVVLGVPCS